MRRLISTVELPKEDWLKLQMAHPFGLFCEAKRSRCVAERSDVVRF